VLRIGGAVFMLAALALTWWGDVLPWLERQYARRRMLDECTVALPDIAEVLDVIERDTSQGHSLHGALQRLVRRHRGIDASLPGCARICHDGSPVDEWCRGLLVEACDPDVRTALSALLLAARTGAPHRSLAVAARVIRQRRALRDEARLATAQARASMQALTWLPFVVLGVLLVVDDGARAAIVRPSGVATSLVGIALNVVGWRWMHRMYGAATVGEDAVPDVLDALSLEVAAGRPPARAVLDVADGPTAAGRLVRPVRDALGDGATVICDGGIRRGGDIVKAVALGADACTMGRTYLYGLGAAGEAGVERALAMLTDELRRAMQLCGVRSLAETGPDLLEELR